MVCALTRQLIIHSWGAERLGGFCRYPLVSASVWLVSLVAPSRCVAPSCWAPLFEDRFVFSEVLVNGRIAASRLFATFVRASDDELF